MKPAFDKATGAPLHHVLSDGEHFFCVEDDGILRLVTAKHLSHTQPAVNVDGNTRPCPKMFPDHEAARKWLEAWAQSPAGWAVVDSGYRVLVQESPYRFHEGKMQDRYGREPTFEVFATRREALESVK